MTEEEKIHLDYICPYCGEITANGVGPSGLKHITTILNKLPSSDVFYRAACQHDMDYHIQIGKSQADENFLINMMEAAKAQSWYQRGLLYSCAYRNYYAVKWFGDAAYRDGACKELYKLNFKEPPFKRI